MIWVWRHPHPLTHLRPCNYLSRDEEEGGGREGGEGGGGRSVSLSVTVRSSVETSKDVGPLFCFVFFLVFLRRTAGGSQSSGRVQPSTQVTSYPSLLLRFVVTVLSCQTERQRHEQWDLSVYKVSLVMWCRLSEDLERGGGNFMTCSRLESDCATRPQANWFRKVPAFTRQADINPYGKMQQWRHLSEIYL